MSEKFSLKWNDFSSNICKSFSLFRNETYLHDVTLVSDDHNKIPAHKLILSACSDYFRDIFKHNQHSHPLICLDGISSEDLKNIMGYIYNGEIQIYQESLDRFMTIAQRFKLEGLMGDKTEELEDGYSNHNEDVRDEDNHFVLESKSNESTLNTRLNIENTTQNVAVVVTNEDDISIKVNEYLEECPEGSFKCTICGKTSGTNMRKGIQRQIIQRHIETHMEGLSYPCSFCQKTLRSRHSLLQHISKFHK